MSSIKKHLFNEHEVNEYFCDQLAINWERINKKVIKNEYVFGSAINYHTKLIKRGFSLFVPPNPVPDKPAFLGLNKFETAVPCPVNEDP